MKLEAVVADSIPDSTRERFTVKAIKDAAKTFAGPIPVFFGTENGIYPFGKAISAKFSPREKVKELVLEIECDSERGERALALRLKPYLQMVVFNSAYVKDVREIRKFRIQAVGLALSEYVDNKRLRLRRVR